MNISLNFGVERGLDGRVLRTWYKNAFQPAQLVQRLDELCIEYPDAALVYMDKRGACHFIWCDEPNKIKKLVKAVVWNAGHVLGFVAIYGEIMLNFPLEGPYHDLNTEGLDRLREFYKEEVPKQFGVS